MIKIDDIYDHQHVDTFFKNVLTSLFWLRYLFQGTVFFLVVQGSTFVSGAPTCYEMI